MKCNNLCTFWKICQISEETKKQLQVICDNKSIIYIPKGENKT